MNGICQLQTGNSDLSSTNLRRDRRHGWFSLVGFLAFGLMASPAIAHPRAALVPTTHPLAATLFLQDADEKKSDDEKKPDDKKPDEKKPVDDKKSDEKKPDSEKKPDTDKKPDDKKSEAKKPDEKPIENIFYLPYKNLRSVFDTDGAAVFVPYGQFLKLWEKSLAPVVSTEPKVKAVITSATYKGKVEKDLANITAELTIQVLGKPWVEVPIHFGDAAIGKYTVSDGKSLLQGNADGSLTLLMATAGEQKVTLELVTKVRTSPDGRSFEFECPPTGMTSFDLTVPVPDQTIEVSPKQVTTKAEGTDKETRVSSNLGATKKIVAKWHPRVSTAPVMELLTSVSSLHDIRIADGLVHTHVTLDYQVLRGQVDQLRLAVPAQHRILDVTAVGLKSWKLLDMEKPRTLVVDLIAPTKGKVTVEVRTERAISDDAVEVAGQDDAGSFRGIHALGVSRESGTVIVAPSSDVALNVEKQTGLVRIEANEAPQAFRRPDNLFYKYFSSKFTLAVGVKPVEPRVVVTHNVQYVFSDRQLAVTANLHAQIERAGVFELRAKVPAGLKVDRVDCPQMKDFQVVDNTTLVITLRGKTLGDVQAVVHGRLVLEQPSGVTLKLPLLEPQGAERETGTISLYSPDALELVTDEKGLVGVTLAGQSHALGAAPPAGERLSATWTFVRRPVEVTVTTRRRPTRLSVDVATNVMAKPDLVEVTSDLKYHVEYAGLTSFRFAVPEAVAASVQVEAAGPGIAIKQKTPAEKAEDGWIVWTVVLQREQTGNVPLRVKYDVRPEAKNNAFTLLVNPIRVLSSPGPVADQKVDVTSVSGEVAVRKDRSLSIAAQGTETEAIDVRELTLLAQDAYLAFRYFKQPETLGEALQLKLSATRHEIQPVVETLVMRALVEAVVTDDTSVMYRCRYHLRTSERQRLRIDLPKGVEPLNTQVAGENVVLEKVEGTGSADRNQSFSISVGHTKVDEPFTVSLVFRAPYRDKPLKGWGGPLALTLPQLGGAQADSGVVTQQLRTIVWVPDDFTLVGQPNQFTIDVRPAFEGFWSGVTAFSKSSQEGDAWFGHGGNIGYSFPTAGHAYLYTNLGGTTSLDVRYWRSSRMTWVISLTILVIAFVLARTSWENRLNIVLVGAFILAVMAVSEQHFVMHLLSAGRYGLAGMILVWLVAGLAALPMRAQTPPNTTPPPVPPTPPATSAEGTPAPA